MSTKSNTKTSSEYISSTSREYSIYTCEHRAIPKIQDGLKDSQRKALWLLRNQSDKVKTISLAGQMISSNLYVHGDASAAQAIGVMAAPFNNNVPLIEGIGTFGTRIAPIDGISAPRYTYVKANAITKAIVYPDIDLVPLEENYDGSTKEPSYFLPIIPLVLLNGISGIAVGWKTDILPRSLSTIVNACKEVLDDKPITNLAPNYDYLDCSITPLSDGSGWTIEGKAEIVSHNHIRVTELPVGVSVKQFTELLNSLEDSDVISSYTNDSTDKIEFNIKFKRGGTNSLSHQDIIKMFGLSKRLTERCVVIDWEENKIVKIDPEDIVKQHVLWRLNWYLERYKKKFNDNNVEVNYWLGIKKCFDNDITSNMSGKLNKIELIKLVKHFTFDIELSDDQIDKIVSLPLYKWTKDEYTRVSEKIDSLFADMQAYIDIIKDEKKLKKIYSTELTNLLKICK